MEIKIDHLLKNMAEFLQAEAKTETVIGDQFKLGEFDCVPVIKVNVGLGGGGGQGGGTKDGAKGEGSGMGAGGGVRVEPIGFLVSKGDEISFLHSGRAKGLAAVFEKVPDLLEKYIDKKKEEDKKSSAS